jgi:hypothetical protein
LQFARMQVQTDMPEQMLPFVATHSHKILSRRSVIVSRQADGTAVGFLVGKVGANCNSPACRANRISPKRCYLSWQHIVTKYHPASIIVSRQADGTAVGFHAGRVGTENFLTLRFGSGWNILIVFSIFDS